MSRPRWARVTAVAAATLAGGALVAFLVVLALAAVLRAGAFFAGASTPDLPLSTGPRNSPVWHTMHVLDWAYQSGLPR